jgi:hypothetical protein
MRLSWSYNPDHKFGRLARVDLAGILCPFCDYYFLISFFNIRLIGN